MQIDLMGRKALVTGAGRGLGRAIVRSLAAQGAGVAFVARSAADIQSLSDELKEGGVRHCALSMDLLADGSAQELAARLGKSGFGELDILVHNLGGTLGVTDPMCSLEDWRRVWRFNMEVAIELNLLFLPAMQRKGWGRIVHMSSISSMENHGPIPYCAAKAALNAYTRSLGRAVAKSGVVVSAILPGAVFTEGGYWDEAQRDRPDHVRHFVGERMAIGRLGRPEEIAGLATFLCSDHASFCIGSIFPADGGQGRGYFGQ
jgi:NAD(P)-dependent dehydrogenase (short-subunit alcohol dehydrogenase family)